MASSPAFSLVASLTFCIAGCGGADEGTAASEATTVATTVVATDPVESCSARLHDSMAAYLNESDQGIDSMALVMLVGKQSPVFLELVGLASTAVQDRFANGADSGNLTLAGGVAELCAQPEVQEAIVGDPPELPTADFAEGSTEHWCVRILYREVSLGFGVPYPSQAALDRSYEQWATTLGFSSPLLSPLLLAVSEVATATIEYGQRDSYPIIASRVNELCATPMLANEALRLAADGELPAGTPTPGIATAPPDAAEPDSFDDVLSDLESSAEVPANDESHVAQQIALAIQEEDADLLTKWADFPMPADLGGRLDLASVSCDEMICAVGVNGGGQVRVTLDYTDRGWYGVGVLLDPNG